MFGVNLPHVDDTCFRKRKKGFEDEFSQRCNFASISEKCASLFLLLTGRPLSNPRLVTPYNHGVSKKNTLFLIPESIESQTAVNIMVF